MPNQIKKPSELINALNSFDAEKVAKVLEDNPDLANIPGNEGKYPLYKAIEDIEDEEIIEIIVNSSEIKDISKVKDGSDQTSLDLALDSNVLDAVKPLVGSKNLTSEIKAKFVKSFLKLIGKNHLDSLKSFLDQIEIESDQAYNEDGTPCQVAAFCKNPEIFKTLVSHKNFHAVNAQDKNGDTALHSLVSFSGEEEKVKLLIDHKADPSIKNNKSEDVYTRAEHANTASVYKGILDGFHSVEDTNVALSHLNVHDSSLGGDTHDGDGF